MMSAMKLSDIEVRHRDGEITRLDEPDLKKIILSTDDIYDLESAIYIYGYNFPADNEIIIICETYINEIKPGITAVCLKVLCRMWGLYDKYLYKIKYFLNSDLLPEWGDECIFSANFCKEMDFFNDDEIKRRAGNIIKLFPELND